MSSVALYNKEAKKIGKVELDDKVFSGIVNETLLHQAMLMYAQNRRSGTASTKTRKEVRGGGRRPWKQKGTGRARASSIRSPIWRGGGVVFGPHPRDYSYSLPKGMKRRALISALNSKLKADGVVVVEKLTIDQAKTKKLAAFLSKLKVGPKPLILLNEVDPNLTRAAQNLPGASIKRPNELNAYDIMRHGKLIIVGDALKTLTSGSLK